MNTIKKPTKGFNTPYQLLVQRLAEFMLEKSPSYFQDDWFNQWNCLDERDCTIAIPIEIGKGEYSTNIKSKSRNIKETPVTFKTIDVNTYFSTVLAYHKRSYGIGSAVSEPGFYFLKASDSVILVVNRGFRFNRSLRFQRCEITPDLYSLSQNGRHITIDCAVVKGEVPIAYV